MMSPAKKDPETAAPAADKSSEKTVETIHSPSAIFQGVVTIQILKIGKGRNI
jgi:hypothetical protein